MADTVGPVPSISTSFLASAIPSLPPAIELAQQPPAALLLAATLSAVVVGRGGNGALLLRTDYGTLALKTALALAAGSRVELKLLPGPPATVLLLDIEQPETPSLAALPAAASAGAPAPAAPAAANGTATPPVAPEAGETEEPPAQLDLGSEVEATLVSPLPGEQNLPALMEGTRLVLRIAVPAPDAPPPPPSGPTPVGIIGTVMPAAADGNARTALQTPWGTLLLDQHLALPPGTALTLTPLATTPPASGDIAMGTVVQARVLPPPPGDAATALPSGTQLTLRLAVLPATPAAAPPAGAASSAAPATATAPTAPAAATPADFIGRVVAGAAGETVVDTPLGMLALEQRLALPPGTLLGLQRLAATPPTPPDDAPVTQSATWPALAQTLSVLDRALPDLAARLRSDLSPASGQQLAGTLLFLMSALNTGAWPGVRVATALDTAGRRDLRQRLDNDLEELHQLAEPAAGDWRTFVLPLLTGGLIRPVRLYLRRRSGASAPPEQGTRFVLEVDTSRLGALQLDGLVRPQRFDLVLRSHGAIAAEMRREIAEVFRNATTASGLAGDISFAIAARFAVAPLDALRAHVGLTA
ncbi:MAG: hypothetical protein ACLQJR_03690 [Stellaceae bacterium]